MAEPPRSGDIDANRGDGVFDLVAVAGKGAAAAAEAEVEGEENVLVGAQPRCGEVVLEPMTASSCLHCSIASSLSVLIGDIDLILFEREEDIR